MQMSILQESTNQKHDIINLLLTYADALFSQEFAPREWPTNSVIMSSIDVTRIFSFIAATAPKLRAAKYCQQVGRIKDHPFQEILFLFLS